jgi:hypothetical protein
MKQGVALPLAVFAVVSVIAAPLWYAGNVAVAARDCDWRGARQGYFFAYCDAPGFADYEHGAYLFNLEPEATRHLAEANVLFLGDSRVQFGFSTSARRDFFKAHPAKYYILGFGYQETSEFPLALLRKYHPPFTTVVINAEPFFAPGIMSIPAKDVTERSIQIYIAYVMKKLVGPLQQGACRTLPSLCTPQKLTLYRSKTTGAWNTMADFGGVLDKRIKVPTIAPPEFDPTAQADSVMAARAFVSEFHLDPKCVVFTAVPNGIQDGRSLAKLLAESLGSEMILPDVPNLLMYDKAHLERQSAERWSGAFFQQYEPIMERCLKASATGQ